MGGVEGRRITEWTATLIARETACLSREDRATVDASVAGDQDRLEAMGLREVVSTCQEAVSYTHLTLPTKRIV